MRREDQLFFSLFCFCTSVHAWRVSQTSSGAHLQAAPASHFPKPDWYSAFGKLQDTPPFIRLRDSVPSTRPQSQEVSPFPDGRILLIDDSAIDHVRGVQRDFHQASVLASFPVSASVNFVCSPWIDGVLYDPLVPGYRMWHSCADFTSCHSTSRDGVRWGNTTQVDMGVPGFLRERGSVYRMADFDGHPIFVGTFYKYRGTLHSTETRSRNHSREEIARDKRSTLGNLVSFSSRDGLAWVPVNVTTERTGDASGSFYDPFSQKFVYVVKLNYLSWIRTQWFFPVESLTDQTTKTWNDTFSSCFAEEKAQPGHMVVDTWEPCLRDGPRSGLLPVPLVDAHDPAYNVEVRAMFDTHLGSDQPAAPSEFHRVVDAYSFHVFPYETLLIGIVALNTGELKDRPKRLDPHLAFATPPASGVLQNWQFMRVPAESQRRPLLRYDRQRLWNIASFGMLAQANSTLIYATAIKTSLDELSSQWDWPSRARIMTSRLRRDGFASLHTASTFDGPAEVMTRTFRADATRRFVFANIEHRAELGVAADSTAIRIQVRLHTDRAIQERQSGHANHAEAQLPRAPTIVCEALVTASGTAVPLVDLHSSKCRVKPGDLVSFAFSWSLRSLHLYSFWASRFATGESGGFQASSVVGLRED
eukprot:TRINITY_DN11892_c0_g1_i1.p1 TRINITY_DN11892_c0_g1~~TRINITY_DN11892_c0_g1_i1.p1  ORF type:complete len:645 (+),score=-72.28 TRINITY_DN11892_c0_g1_i1:84-2018(+)